MDEHKHADEERIIIVVGENERINFKLFEVVQILNILRSTQTFREF